MAEANDFDAEAHRLFAQLGNGNRQLPPAGGKHFHDLDCVFEHSGTGARVYIGNLNAARSAGILDEHRITRVVNCQDMSTANYHENNPKFKYLRFPIAWWQRAKDVDTSDGILRFFAPLFAWIDEAMAARENVLIHCLAGAHRAGTTGVAVVMYLTKANAMTALMETKNKRPIVDPIMSLGELLLRLDNAMERSKASHGAQKPCQQVPTNVRQTPATGRPLRGTGPLGSSGAAMTGQVLARDVGGASTVANQRCRWPAA